MILFFGLFASFAFVLGIFSGEVLFIASIKRTSGAIDISFRNSPGWFCVLTLANLVVALVTWCLFFSWLRERRRCGGKCMPGLSAAGCYGPLGRRRAAADKH